MLTDATLRDVLDAALAAQLDRNTLLSGVDPRVKAGLATAPTPKEQLLADLHGLRAMGTLPDNSLPLRTWLTTAVHLADPRRETAVFKRALAELDVASTAAPPAQTAGPAERAKSGAATSPAPNASTGTPPQADVAGARPQ
jgi:hypothetical protein